MAGFYRENDHQPAIRHLEYVKRRVDDAVDHFNERYPDRPITKSIYFIGTDYEGMPGCVGGRYSYKDGKWEFYKVDDRYHLLVNGPFSDDGIICSP